MNTVFGDLGNADVISKQTAASDIIIHTATADDLPSVQAVIKGIRQRADQGLKTIYIHTSGTSLLSDQSKGQYKSETIFHDSTPDEIDALPDSAPHREIDLEIVHARKELGTKAKLFIMIPPLIYGAVKDIGLLSIQVPTMTRFAIKHRYAGHVGGGKAVWSTVHVADLARAYVMVLHWIEKAPDSVALENPYFFCENGEEISWGELAGMIGSALQPLGKLDDGKPKEIPETNYNDIFGEYSTVVCSANSRSRAQRVREMGWQPREKIIRDAFISEELPLLLEEKGEFHGYSKAVASGATG